MQVFSVYQHLDDLKSNILYLDSQLHKAKEVIKKYKTIVDLGAERLKEAEEINKELY